MRAASLFCWAVESCLRMSCCLSLFEGCGGEDGGDIRLNVLGEGAETRLLDSDDGSEGEEAMEEAEKIE